MNYPCGPMLVGMPSQDSYFGWKGKNCTAACQISIMCFWGAVKKKKKSNPDLLKYCSMQSGKCKKGHL